MARVRISTSSLNSYGTRVLTAGLDTSQYEKNPVLLWMHQRGNVIGTVEALRREGDALTGELVFDEVTELSRRCKAQFAKGSLRMVSIGADILELSDDPAHIVPGQTRPTVTRSKLREVSVVDLGANDDALRLTYEGKNIELGSGLDCGLPLIGNNTKEAAIMLQHTKQNDMDIKKIALQLGLEETAGEADVTAKITELKGKDDEAVRLAAQVKTLQEENDGLKLAGITHLVEEAVKEKKVSAEKKGHFIELGKKVGSAELKALFAEMQPAVKLSAVIGHQGGAAEVQQPTDAKKLGDLTPEQRVELKASDLKQYRALYQAEYGVECPV